MFAANQGQVQPGLDHVLYLVVSIISKATIWHDYPVSCPFSRLIYWATIIHHNFAGRAAPDTESAMALPAVRPEKMQPPKKVPSSER